MNNKQKKSKVHKECSKIPSFKFMAQRTRTLELSLNIRELHTPFNEGTSENTYNLRVLFLV